MPVAASLGSRSLEFIWSWFQEGLRGLRLRENELLAGSFTPSELEPHLLGLSTEELKALFSDYRAELDAAAALALMASTEAALRADYQNRISRKLKDPVSREFRNLRKSRKNRIRLDEDILGVWADRGRARRSAVAEFRGVLNYRDWLAHGRYWKARLGRPYEARDAFVAGSTLLQSVALLA